MPELSHNKNLEYVESLSKNDVRNPSVVPLDIACHRCKSVTFAPSVEVLEVNHLNDLSKEEIECLWITKEEMSEMMGRAQHNVERLKRNLPCARGDCKRGLENHLDDQQNLRSQTALYAVLEAQEIFCCDGFLDSECIAETYCQLTFDCMEEAHEIALRDAQEIYSSESCALCPAL